MPNCSPSVDLAYESLERCHSYSAEDTVWLGRQVAMHLRSGDVLLLTGDLGAGKTQFVRGAACAMGVDENVISPTFNILLVHEGKDATLLHWDLYRLQHSDELIDIDYFTLVESEAISLVEWGDKFEDTYLDADGEVVFTYEGESERILAFKPLSPRGVELASAFASICSVRGDRE